MYRDNLETKHHFILLLKNADDARRDIEKHLSPEKVNEYNKICAARNMAFAKLIELDVEFMCLEGGKTRIVIDDEFYDIKNSELKQYLGADKFETLIASKSQNVITMQDLKEGCSNDIKQSNVYAIPAPQTLQTGRDIENRIKELSQMGGTGIERNPYAGMQPQQAAPQPAQPYMQPIFNPYIGTQPINPYAIPYMNPYLIQPGMYPGYGMYTQQMQQPSSIPGSADIDNTIKKELDQALKAAEKAKEDAENKSKELEEAKLAASKAEKETLSARNEKQKTEKELNDALRKVALSDAEALRAREEADRTAQLLKETEKESNALNKKTLKSQDELMQMQKELENARKTAEIAMAESENAKRKAEETSIELEKAKLEAENANKGYEAAVEEAKKINHELESSKEAVRKAEQESTNAKAQAENANKKMEEALKNVRQRENDAEQQIAYAKAIAEKANNDALLAKESANNALQEKEMALKESSEAKKEAEKARSEMIAAQNELNSLREKSEVIRREAEQTVNETQLKLENAKKELELATAETRQIKEEALQNAEKAAIEAKNIAKNADIRYEQAKHDAEEKLRASEEKYKQEIAFLKEDFEKKSIEKTEQYEQILSKQNHEYQLSIENLKKHLDEKERLIQEANATIEAEKEERKKLLEKAEMEKNEIICKAAEMENSLQKEMKEKISELRAEADAAISKSAVERERINHEFEEKRKELEDNLALERKNIKAEAEEQIQNSEKILQEKLESTKAECDSYVNEANQKINEVQSLIAQERIKAEQYKNLAYTDSLTGIGNRAAYNDYISQMTAEFFCFAFIDVNHVKRTNDFMGHEYGDKLIKLTADGLTSILGEHVFRIGGDEFICIIENERRQTVKMKMQKLREHFASTYIDDGVTPISVAIGYEFGNIDSDLHKMYENAEERMYNNKEKMKANRGTDENENPSELEKECDSTNSSSQPIETETVSDGNTPLDDNNHAEDIDYESLLDGNIIEDDDISFQEHEEETAINNEQTDDAIDYESLAEMTDAVDASENNFTDDSLTDNVIQSEVNQIPALTDSPEKIRTSDDFNYEELEEDVLQLDEHTAFRDISQEERYLSVENLTYSYSLIKYNKNNKDCFFQIIACPVYAGGKELIIWAMDMEYTRTLISDFSSEDKSVSVEMDDISVRMESNYINGGFHVDIILADKDIEKYQMHIETSEQNAKVGSGHLDEMIDGISVSIYPLGSSNTGTGAESLYIFRDGQQSQFGKTDMDGIFTMDGNAYISQWDEQNHLKLKRI